MLLMWNVNYQMLDIIWKEESCIMMLIFWIVFWMYVYLRWKVVVWIAKWWDYHWQRKYEKCDMGCGLAYI